MSVEDTYTRHGGYEEPVDCNSPGYFTPDEVRRAREQDHPKVDDMSNEFLRRRVLSQDDNADIPPADALRLALADLEDGEVSAESVVLFFMERDEDGVRTYHAYRGGLPVEEEVLLLTAELDRAVQRWRGGREP